MNLFYRDLRWFHAKVCSIWNKQYYFYSGVSSNAVFAAAFPGLVRIVAPLNCRIGRGRVINAGVVIHCAGGVSIGDHVHIGHGFCIYSTTTTPAIRPYLMMRLTKLNLLKLEIAFRSVRMFQLFPE